MLVVVGEENLVVVGEEENLVGEEEKSPLLRKSSPCRELDRPRSSIFLQLFFNPSTSLFPPPSYQPAELVQHRAGEMMTKARPVQHCGLLSLLAHPALRHASLIVEPR